MELGPGSRVINKFTQKKGTVLQDENSDDGHRLVLWDDGRYQSVLVTALLSENISINTPFALLKNELFSGVSELRLALTKERLSGRVDNLIYSLNFTKTEFLAYQFKPVLAFLRSRVQSLLIADEVGLGKTIEAGLIWSELKMREKAKSLLVVCPAVLCDKWKMELETKFYTRAEIINGAELFEIIKNSESGVYIVSIQSARRLVPRKQEQKNKPLQTFEQLGIDQIFDLLVVDEAHIIRNEETKSNAFINQIKKFCRHTLLLSATPIQTKNSDLFSLVTIIAPYFFPSLEAMEHSIEENKALVDLCGRLQRPITRLEFVERIQTAIESVSGDTKEQLKKWLDESIDDNLLKSQRERSRITIELNKLIPLFQIMTRTLKSEVTEGKVIREPQVIKVEPSKAEKLLYEMVTEAVKNYCLQMNIPWGFAVVMPQRLVSSSPQAAYLQWEEGCWDDMIKKDFTSDEYLQEITEDTQENDEENSQQESLQRDGIRRIISDVLKKFEFKAELIQEDTKFNKLLGFIRKFRTEQGNKKILLFSYFKNTLNRLQQQLTEVGISSVIYDGNIPQELRGSVIEDFKNGSAQILLSSEVASEGIDLQFMNCVINYDLPWNPAKIEQRIGRIDRIGQKSKKVFIVNFVHKNTIDDVIYTRLLARMEIFRQALGLAQEILGKEILKLTKELFLEDLTNEQQKEVVEQTVRAWENIKLQEQSLRQGESIIFNAIQEQILEAQKMERYITSKDLLAYIKSFFYKEGTNSYIVPILQDGALLYKLQLSHETFNDFRDYQQKMGMLTRETSIVRNREVVVSLYDKKNKKMQGIEQIAQDHPFISFITHWLKNKNIEPHKLSAVTLDRGKLPKEFINRIRPSYYLYWISSWSTKGRRRDSVTLNYCVLDMERNDLIEDDLAEALINAASLEGVDWKVTNVKNKIRKDKILSAFNEVEKVVRNKFNSFSALTRRAHQNEVNFEKRQQYFQLESLESDYQRRLDSLNKEDHHWQKGLIAALNKEFKPKLESVKNIIAGIDSDAKRFMIDDSDVSVGLVEVI